MRGDRFIRTSSRIDDHDKVQTPSITFSARYISLFNALKIITSVNGLVFRIKDETVAVMARDDIDGEPFEMRLFHVIPTFLNCVRDCDPISPPPNEPNIPTLDLKQIFGQMGISWPRGSSITYNPGIEKVIVANTVENLQRFEKLIRELNVVPYQLQITTRFVSLATTNITSFASGKSGPDKILNLCTNGAGHLIAAPIVIMNSGETSCVKSVTQIIYPAEPKPHDTGSSNSTDTTGTRSASSKLASRETGLVLDIMPQISPSGDYITVSLKGSLGEEPEWRDSRNDVQNTGASTQNRQSSTGQPWFHQNRFDSKLTVTDGSSLLALGGLPTQDGKSLIYCIITVRVIGNDGLPLKRDDQLNSP